MKLGREIGSGTCFVTGSQDWSFNLLHKNKRYELFVTRYRNRHYNYQIFDNTNDFREKVKITIPNYIKKEIKNKLQKNYY